MEIMKNRESFGKWFSLTYKGPRFVSLGCFLDSEIDTAIWLHRPKRCMIVACVHERTHDSSLLMKFWLICTSSSFYSTCQIVNVCCFFFFKGSQSSLSCICFEGCDSM